MKKQIEEIDRLTEVNSNLFWRHINSRRKKSNSFSGYKLNFNGRIASTPQEVSLNIFYTDTITKQFNEMDLTESVSLYKPSPERWYDI